MGEILDAIKDIEPCLEMEKFYEDGSRDLPNTFDIYLIEFNQRAFQELRQLSSADHNLDRFFSSYFEKTLKLNNVQNLMDVLKYNYRFKELIPKIANLALKISNSSRYLIPKLRTNKSGSITLSQKLCSIILANAFFCTFQSKVDSYQNINFNKLYDASLPNSRNETKKEKIKCLLHYFQRVLKESPTGKVTFSRKKLNDVNNFKDNLQKSQLYLSECEIKDREYIEDSCGSLQVDFANEFIGGGILSNGSVQEEIRFSICPEMIVSLLFCERLGNDEAIILRGCERYSDYTGYASNFKWLRDHRDPTSRDSKRRKNTYVIAIDATNFSSKYQDQFSSQSFEREIIKCYAGFSISVDKSNNTKYSVATGHWGCGAFCGNKQLKFLIQILVASFLRHKLIYHTFGESDAVQQFKEITILLKDINLSNIIQITLEFLKAKSKNPYGMEFLDFFKSNKKQFESLRDKRNLVSSNNEENLNETSRTMDTDNIITADQQTNEEKVSDQANLEQVGINITGWLRRIDAVGIIQNIVLYLMLGPWKLLKYIQSSDDFENFCQKYQQSIDEIKTVYQNNRQKIDDRLIIYQNNPYMLDDLMIFYKKHKQAIDDYKKFSQSDQLAIDDFMIFYQKHKSKINEFLKTYENINQTEDFFKNFYLKKKQTVEDLLNYYQKHKTAIDNYLNSDNIRNLFF